MSELYEKYAVGKDPSKAMMDIVRAVYDGELGGDDLAVVSDELERDNLFNGEIIIPASRSDWNESYLERLEAKVVSGVFSREYLLHLNEVADYIHGGGADDKQGNKTGCFIALAAVALITAAALIILVLNVM